MKKIYSKPMLELEGIKLFSDVLSVSSDPEETIDPNLGETYNEQETFTPITDDDLDELLKGLSDDIPVEDVETPEIPE